MLKWIQILWPSFMVACIAELVFFTVIDPGTLYLFGEPVEYSMTATYSIAFFCLWAICAAAALATLLLQRKPSQVNARG